MFAKLLKHEMKSVGGTLGILTLAALAVGVLGGVLFRIGMSLPEAYEKFSMILSIPIPFLLISLVAYAIGGEIYLITRFYKRKFSDEGYLTFTLPVPTWQIYLSSLLNLMFWMLIIGFVTVLSILSLFLIAYVGQGFHTELTEVGVDVSWIYDQFAPHLTAWKISADVMSFLSSNVLIITCITLGSVVAKKHKILASIGCYYGISIVTGIISSAASSVSILAAGPEKIFDAMYMATAATQLITAVGGSVLSIWLMNKKLNLP